MNDISTTDDIFFNRTGLNQIKVENIVKNSLHGADDGELFMEYNENTINNFKEIHNIDQKLHNSFINYGRKCI